MKKRRLLIGLISLGILLFGFILIFLWDVKKTLAWESEFGWIDTYDADTETGMNAFRVVLGRWPIDSTELYNRMTTDDPFLKGVAPKEIWTCIGSSPKRASYSVKYPKNSGYKDCIVTVNLDPQDAVGFEFKK